MTKNTHIYIGMQREADAMVDAELAATGMDREVYFSLPADMRHEVLQGEVTERRRRASYMYIYMYK
jgi:hypothetical protein